MESYTAVDFDIRHSGNLVAHFAWQVWSLLPAWQTFAYLSASYARRYSAPCLEIRFLTGALSPLPCCFAIALDALPATVSQRFR